MTHGASRLLRHLLLPISTLILPGHDLRHNACAQPGLTDQVHTDEVHYSSNMSDMQRRTEYLGKTLESLAGLSGLDRVTVYVSQDGQDTAVSDLVQQYGQGVLAPPHTSFFEHWQRERVPQLGPEQARCIAAHAAWCCYA